MPKKNNVVPLVVIGFKDETAFVRGIAKEFGVAPQFAVTKKYKAGESAVSIPAPVGKKTVVAANAWEDPRWIFNLLLLLGAEVEAGAKEVILIAPWIAYGRQDRAAKPGETSAGETIAGALLSTGVDKIITLDAHSPRFMKFFKGRLQNIRATDAAAAFASKHKINAVAAADLGARERALEVSQKLKASMIQITKKRLKSGSVESGLLKGDAKNKRVLIIDDIADSGETLFKAAEILKRKGAVYVSAFVSHAVCLARLKKEGRKRGLDNIFTVFDHATRSLNAPFNLFVPTRQK
ncbi:ribose-phosphate diphosphokinase [Patescibacteria group bacterium]|nr:ribose-phosphate diphosphokinase [Patescibacteria group bacterium]MBU1630067.1 ribose-phosphate diphosphokinase [Patescibacteria group bacterium]MBU1908211.1 ribose-phosphate diphosphokinase [Patescibacteria group bacterium]